MAANIKTLLRKTTLSGDEVGRAFLTNMMTDYKNILDGYRGEDMKGVFSQSEFTSMVNKLSNSYQIERYNHYISISNFIRQYNGFSEAYYQQAQVGFYKILNYVTGALSYENMTDALSRQPLIMTKKEYEDIKEETIKYMGSLKESFWSIATQGIQYYINLLHSHPRKKNILKEVMKKYETEPYQNPVVISKLNEIWDEGYYIAPDGTRSCDVSEKEWQNITMRVFAGEDWEKNDPLDNAIKAREHKFYANPADIFIWKTADEPPKGITKANILLWEDDAAADLIEYYPEIYSDNQEEAQQCFEEFINDFPELWEIISADIIEKIPAAAAFKEDIHTQFITWAELEILKVYDYSTEPNQYHIADTISQKDKFRGHRAGYGGIAVIENCSEYDQDDRGYYKESSIGRFQKIFKLEVMYKNDLKEIMAARNDFLISGLKDVYATNAAIDIITELTKVDMSIFKMSTGIFESQIKSLNGLINQLSTKISDFSVGLTEEQIQERERILNTLFPYIDVEELKPLPEQIEEIKQYTADLSAFDSHTAKIVDGLRRAEDGQ